MNGIVTAAPTVGEAEALAADVRTRWPEVSRLPEEVRGLGERLGTAEQQLSVVRRGLAAARPEPRPAPRAYPVSQGLARRIAAAVIVMCERGDKLGDLTSSPHGKEELRSFAREELGITTRAALTTTEIPLPSTYGAELAELTSQFGVARQKMTRYPIGLGTAKPARMGTRPAFGSVAMSAAFAERSPSIEFASLESHKIGGIVRLPREIDEQSIVAMGDFLARYAAIEFARAEDEWAFNADGSGTYENVKGIVQIARDNTKTVVLGAGKTHPSDVVLENFRTLRSKANKAVLNGRFGAYYMDSTWSVFLPSLRTAADPNVYIVLPDGSARLDGYPVIWTDVLQGYTTSAAADTAICVFGSLSHWWMGEHGYPRLDTSEHVFFVNDQLAVRCMEELDYDYMAVDATAALITAAA